MYTFDHRILILPFPIVNFLSLFISTAECRPPFLSISNDPLLLFCSPLWWSVVGCGSGGRLVQHYSIFLAIYPTQLYFRDAILFITSILHSMAVCVTLSLFSEAIVRFRSICEHGKATRVKHSTSQTIIHLLKIKLSMQDQLHVFSCDLVVYVKT